MLSSRCRFPQPKSCKRERVIDMKRSRRRFLENSSLAVAGLAASSPTIVQNAGCITDSFPEFVETMQILDVKMEWRG